MRSELGRLKHEEKEQKEKIKDNTDKIKQNKQLPYLVSNVVEVRRLSLVLPLPLARFGADLAAPADSRH
jgi:ATP-dependent 26S proteasome regulatory subunit